MKKNPFKDLQATDGMLRVLYAIERIAIIIGVIVCFASGIVWCVNYSVLYGCLMIFGGIFAGIILFLLVWCNNAVMRCFYDAACATKELYTKEHPESAQAVEAPSESEEIAFAVYNERTKRYASDLKGQALLFSTDEDDSMRFDDVDEAMRLMRDYGLTQKDGWITKQIKL